MMSIIISTENLLIYYVFNLLNILAVFIISRELELRNQAKRLSTASREDDGPRRAL